MNNYKELIVWQKSMQLVGLVYKITEKFPQKEMYGLTSQMRRSATSIPSNIAEGSRRGSRKDFRQFIIIAFGSGAELETQFEIAKMIGFALSEKEEMQKAEALLLEVMKMLNALLRKLEASKSTHYSLPTTH